MRSDRIGGQLDWRDLAEPSRVQFAILTREQQAAAIRRMAAEGHGEQSIAVASGLNVEAIRRALAEHPSAGEQGEP